MLHRISTRILKNSLARDERARKRKNGFTLIETAVVVLILSILIAAYLIRTHAAINGGNSAAIKAQILALEAAAHDYASNIGALNYSGLSSFIATYTTASGNTSSILPQSYTSAGILNAFQGYAVLSSSANAAAFQITEPNLPSDTCNSLATFFSQHGTATCSGGILTIVSQ